MSNYPDGMRESDIPGYDDTDGTIRTICPECGYDGEVEGTFTPSGRGRYATLFFSGSCPECGADIDEDDAGPEPDWESIAAERDEARCDYYDY